MREALSPFPNAFTACFLLHEQLILHAALLRSHKSQTASLLGRINMIPEPKPFTAWAATHVFIDRKPVMEQVKEKAQSTTPRSATVAQRITH